MAEFREHSPQELFRQWRGGNAQAGGAMAQRFTDWYYSIALARLGDAQGRPLVRRACERFEKGIVEVASAGELLDWAHRQIAEEYAANPRLAAGADSASKLTGGRRPSDLLDKARAALPADTVRLLDLTYGPGSNLDEIGAEADRLGGMPLAILQARHTLKRWLKDNLQVDFSVVPAELNLDCAPLPLYEAARMAAQGEEPEFEKWLLSDIELCKDIAEFAVFAHALRAGAFRGALTRPEPVRPDPVKAEPAKAEPPQAEPPKTPSPAAEPPRAESTRSAPPKPRAEPARPAASPPAEGGSNKLILIGVLVVVLVLGVIGALVVLGVIGAASY